MENPWHRGHRVQGEVANAVRPPGPATWAGADVGSVPVPLKNILRIYIPKQHEKKYHYRDFL